MYEGYSATTVARGQPSAGSGDAIANAGDVLGYREWFEERHLRDEKADVAKARRSRG